MRATPHASTDTPGCIWQMLPGESLPLICSRGDRVMVTRGQCAITRRQRGKLRAGWRVLGFLAGYVVTEPGAYVLTCVGTGETTVGVTRRGGWFADLMARSGVGER